MDFFMISTRPGKKDVIEIYPRFIIPTRKKSSDLMIRGGDFYAVWMQDKGLWSTDEGDVLQAIDHELDLYLESKQEELAAYKVRVLHMWDAQTGMIDTWHRYCQKQLRDSYHNLDEKIIFSNDKSKKEDYASKRLSYPLEKGSIEAYDKLMSVLYSEEERHKIEWAIGSVVAGDSKTIQKFIVLYGEAGTGKSTVLNIIESLFEEYCISFESKTLGQSNAAFALEQFRANPLVAIDHEGKLSTLEDNTRLNSIVSHDKMIVNEKFKSPYENRFKCFLFIGTNEPVRITNAKSGLLRRLIDVSPTGNKVPSREYKKLTKQINFELGAIAQHCLEVYYADPDRYETYIPTAMLGATNDFYNFVLDSYTTYKRDDGVSLQVAYEQYKTYCKDALVSYPYTRRVFKEELKNYFKEYYERYRLDDGTRVRNYYKFFRVEKFEETNEEPEKKEDDNWLVFKKQHSIFDDLYSDCPAQYATADEKPTVAWDNVKTTLKELDTNKLHYILTQAIEPKLIVIDFDIKDPETGEKSYELNLAAASKWPKTYAELSKSGKAIHLHYIYAGDVSKLSRLYDDDIEIKVFTGKSSLRRALTLCNDISIATISSGLPLKKGDNVVNEKAVKSEKSLRNLIIRNLNKEIHSSTASSVDFIYHILEDAYNSGISYDISDMKPSIIAFAASSSNQSKKCLDLVAKMKFKSENEADAVESENDILVFYDVEVFPNLFIVNWKKAGKDQPVIRMINPTGEQINELTKFRLVGFNNRRYDNHILYGRIMGFNNHKLYELSKRIISDDKSALFGQAYNLSYTDVYDYSSDKKSLKKWEIELGIHHQELGLPWDQPVPEELWAKVAEYCDNDVIATEAVFEATQPDFVAREILADITGSTVNDSTNSLAKRFIFRDDKHPQSKFNYRFMGDESAIVKRLNHMPGYEGEFWDLDPEYTAFDKDGKPIFPGYTHHLGRSMYRDEDPKQGGYVYSEPGMYFNVGLFDISSMHPSSIRAENLFGDEYTKRFGEIVDMRLAIKHKDFESARKMLNGTLTKYLDDPGKAKGLAQALKIVINAVYGQTKATYECIFRDERNIDNIVAKRGALFMINLKHEVQRRGYTVAHIKTDSIKIPNADQKIKDFVMAYGKLYGYNFEHEATYDRMCLIDKANYICKYDGHWSATGDHFKTPYVFKKLFSHEPIAFRDLCETKSVTKGELYLDMNESLPDVSAQEKELDKASQKYKKGLLSDISYDEIKARLEPEIEEGHSYQFVGRVGSFCPIRPGCGGGVLYRKQDGKYYAAAGTKGYRWLESELVRDLSNASELIDESYYISLVDDAIDTISQYGDFEMFVSDDPLAPYMNIPQDSDDEIPFHA